MSEITTLEFHRLVQAPLSLVYRAFTSDYGLQEWLCDAATVLPFLHGRTYLYWQEGSYFAGGQYTNLVPNEHISFTWHGKDEPRGTEVHVHLIPADEGTRITLRHAGIGSGEAWTETKQAFQHGWEVGLENLQSVLETGIDLRIARRPFMGILFGGDNSPQIAATLGIPVTHGAQISGTLAGTGAEDCGLQKDDVIVEMGGNILRNWGSIPGALTGAQAGDSLEIVFYRGAERHQTALILSARPLPTPPATAAELAEQMRTLYVPLNEELAKIFDGVSDEQASRVPNSSDWNAKEVLAHLVLTEIDNQNWVGCEVEDQANAAASSNTHCRVKTLAKKNGTVPALLASLHQAQNDLVELITNLPDSFLARKASYRRLTQVLLFVATHYNPHFDQIRTVLASSKR